MFNVQCTVYSIECIVYSVKRIVYSTCSSNVPAAMEVLHDHPHEHVEYEKAHEEEEGDEVDQAPLVVVLLGLGGRGGSPHTSYFFTF